MKYKGRRVKRVWKGFGGDDKIKILLQGDSHSKYVKPEEVKGYER